MLRVLLCMNCCSGSQLNQRPLNRKVSVQHKSEKPYEEKHELAGELEKYSLINQIEASNSNLTGKPKHILTDAHTVLKDQAYESGLLEASTSTHGGQEESKSDDNNNKPDSDQLGRNVSSSSINVDQYKENTNLGEKSHPDNSEQWYRSSEPLDTSASTRVPSVSKIGDYARIEYSPVEDLESETNKTSSRGYSERPVNQKPSSNALITPNYGVDLAEAAVDIQNSTRGLESSSISIASQLSNEIENMLESAITPTTMFGAIGLPLGPPLDSQVTETRKTSPDTNGAALTSQDSLSDVPIPSPTRRAATLNYSGAALVGTSPEMAGIYDSMEQASATLPSPSRVAAPLKRIKSTERMDSSASMATSYSNSMTNPTPTPSEVSSKKSKLSAKGLFKKLKPKKKKKKDKGESVTADAKNE